MRQLNKLVVKFKTRDELVAIDTVARLLKTTPKAYARDVIIRDLVRIDGLIKKAKAEEEAKRGTESQAISAGDSSGESVSPASDSSGVVNEGT